MGPPFCPFIQDRCDNNCVFFSEKSLSHKVRWPYCIIASKLMDINAEQEQQLEDIKDNTNN